MADATEALAVRALDAMLRDARTVPHGGLAWTARAGDERLNACLYNGTSGVVLTLLEAWRHFGDDRYADAAVRGARSIADAVDGWDHASLHMGRTGMAFALHSVHGLLGDPGAADAAHRALGLVRAGFDGTRWHPNFEYMKGNAGIALGALHCGDPELALLAAEPYLRTAETTAHGVHWEVRTGHPARLHHISHGTLGIAMALARTGEATGRTDLTELALAGVRDVVARDEAGPEGFLVPHSDPQDRPGEIPRFSYGWCHGPAGDAQVFRLLRDLTGDPAWSGLADRCWRTVTTSGLPQPLRPGFWDNSGHCCGTAGVLAFTLDRHVERGDGLPFAGVLTADLAARAVTDPSGARWPNTDPQATPTTLPTEPGWAMGNAGIARELLRHARVVAGGDERYAVQWPDQPPAAAPASPRAT